jgi:plastocyanin
MTGTSAHTRRAVAACLFAAALAGCSSSPSGGNTAANTAAGTTSAATTSAATGTVSSAAVITIKNFAFRTPGSVRPGATVTVRNEDSTEHTVTADSGNAFDSTQPSGGSSSFTAPTKPGSYPFHCTIHPFMHGTLVVQ